MHNCNYVHILDHDIAFEWLKKKKTCLMNNTECVEIWCESSTFNSNPCDVHYVDLKKKILK